MKVYRKIINVASIIFLLLLVLFYGYRLVYYYKLEHQPNTNAPIPFHQRLINNKGIEGTNYGLLEDGDGYLYGPKSTDNYVYYVGRLWRIIGLDKDGNIKLITDEGQTILAWEDDKTFKESNIYTWLNKTDDLSSGVFEKSLKETISSNILTNDAYVSLLTRDEFEKIGSDSYLVNGTNFWLAGDNRSYVNANGEVTDETNDYDAFNVRPVIVINSSYNYISGTGTKEDPYIIYAPYKEQLSSTYVGEYLKYNNLLWRIIDTNDNIKVALEGYETSDEVFSHKSNKLNDEEGIGYFLNNDYYNRLENNDYIVPSNYYIGSFDNYSYVNTYNDSVLLYVGLPQIGDFFINSYDNYYTLTPLDSSDETIYVINDHKRLFADFIDEAYQIRPVLYLDKEIFILNGDGTKDNPYEIGR